MARSRLDLSVVIPAYNEAERLPRTLRRLQEYLRTKPWSYEILVVLDGPTDGTRAVLNELSPQIDHLEVLDGAVHRGKGHAVRKGMLHARGRSRLFSDADNSTDISHVEKMLPLLDQGCDIVICSRHPRDARGARQAVPQPWYKRCVGSAGNLFVQLVALPGIWDTQCGFKLFSEAAAEEIFSRAVVDGWAFDIEALALARALGYRIGMAPAHWINDAKSHVAWHSYLEVLWDTVKLRWRLSAGGYDL